MKTHIHSLRMVRMWVYTKKIEEKGTRASLEELATYLELCRILRQNDWSYERTMQVLDEIIQYQEESRGTT